MALGFAQFSCNKDSFTTKPQLTFLRLSGDNIPINNPLIIYMKLTDKEGDLQDTLFYRKESKNCPASNQNARYAIPLSDKRANLDAEIELNFFYTNQGGISGVVPIGNGCSLVPGRPNDTCVFKIWVQDAAKNRSDTVTTPRIVLRRP